MQDPKARAILTVGETPLYLFVQAAMRLRGLSNSQTIDIILLNQFLSIYPQYENSDSEITLTNFFNCLFEIQLRQLIDTLHPGSLFHMIENVFLSYIIKMLKSESSPNGQRQIVLNFYDFLFKQTSLSFFEKYGAAKFEVDTPDI